MLVPSCLTTVITDALPKEIQMGRAVKDARLDKRDARLKLATQKEPYWRLITEGSHLGYYRGERVAKWVARHRRPGAGGGYLKKTLGEADDIRDADGAAILNFRQADDAARAWFESLARDREAEASGPVVTVRSAVEDYISARDAKESARQGRAVRSSASQKLQLHVLADEALATLQLGKLTTAQLVDWRKGLAGTAASRQRVTNDFKAALNRIASSAVIRLAIKDGLATPGDDLPDAASDDAADIESKILTDDETRRFLIAVRNGAGDDLYLMCLVLASTGTRFAQARRLKVRDVQVARGRIMIPASHKGRVGTQARAAVPVPVGDDVLEALTPAIKGRKGDEPLLERWRHIQTGPRVWTRDTRGPWQSAAEMARPIRAAATAAELPASASSYSFRHSSIVRALREGLPVRLVAQLHDTSLAMIERNYTRFMAHALEDIARKAIMPLVQQDRGDNVVAIGGTGRSA